MEPGGQEARLRITGNPTDAEVAAVVLALETVTARDGEEPERARPRVWQRPSLRSHARLLQSTLHPGTDGGHHFAHAHQLEES